MTKFYLWENENRHAPVRSDGRRYWGYPSRRGGTDAIDAVVVHTAENNPDWDGPDSGAERIARYGSTTSRPASWHTCVDSDSIIPCLPARAVAFHVRGYNTRTVGIEICTQARRWGQNRKWDWKAYRNAAKVVGYWCFLFDLPVRHISKSDLDKGRKGITTHAELDPSRRSDPGKGFKMWTFLKLTKHYRNRAIRHSRRK